jgi:hypothetical protein
MQINLFGECILLFHFLVFGMMPQNVYIYIYIFPAVKPLSHVMNIFMVVTVWHVSPATSQCNWLSVGFSSMYHYDRITVLHSAVF